jgi:hypothetical protein
MLKFDLQAAGLKTPVIHHRFTARRNQLQKPPQKATPQVDETPVPAPSSNNVHTSTAITNSISSIISAPTSVRDQASNATQTITDPPVSQQIARGLSRAIVVYRGRYRKTQTELLKAAWLALPFFNKMARRPRLVEYGSIRGEVRRSHRIKARLLITL